MYRHLFTVKFYRARARYYEAVFWLWFYGQKICLDCQEIYSIEDGHKCNRG